MTQLSHLTPISTRLINGLSRLQATGLDLPLVPLNDNKQPLGDGWQHRPLKASQLVSAIENGGVTVPIQGKTKKIQLQGFGLLTGRPITLNSVTYYLMALDQDGASAADKIQELSGGQPLPKTVAFSSGRPGRCQYLFLVPEQYKDAIRTKKVKTGVIGDDRKPEQVEFRWTNLQSVLPPSVHPTTGQYHWVSGCAIDEIELAIAPNWIIEQMLIDPTPAATPLLNSISPAPSRHNGSYQQWTDIDFALSYLNALSSYRADDYDEWLAVGMALHSVDDSLLSEWDKWSQQSAKYKSGECEKKWKSFSNNGGVTLGTLAHMAKLDGWQFPFSQNQRNRRIFPHSRQTQNNSANAQVARSSQHPHSTVTGDSPATSDRSTPEQLSLTATVTTVTTLLQNGLKDYEERAELDALQQRSTLSLAAFWELVKALRCSLDEIQPSDTNRLNQLIDWHNATLDFDKILPHPLTTAFLHDAQVLNIDPVSLWQYFLPAVLSLAGKRVNLDVESHRIPAIAWTCLVSESGTGKTRAEAVILAPLKEKQHQEKQRWTQEIKEYKQLLKNSSKDSPSPEPPFPERKYLFEVATIQAVMRRLSEQGLNGSIWARDEIAGLFKSLGQFNALKGDSEGLECLLKMWDGDGSFVDRMDAEEDSYAIAETRLNIAGGIQPGAFRQAFKDPNDPQGLQARFLYAVPKVYKAKRVKGYCQLSDFLPALYSWLDQCPTGTVKLSRDADRYYTYLVEQMGEQAERELTPAIRAWMRKLPTQLLRIALALHLVECYSERQRNFWELQKDTLERALSVCRYYRSAFQVVQEKAANSDSISSILLKIWDMATTQPDGVTPRDIYRGIKAIARRASELGRQVGAYTLELLSKMVEMGKGKIQKEGRFYRFFAVINPPELPNLIINQSSLTSPTGNESQSRPTNSHQETSQSSSIETSLDTELVVNRNPLHYRTEHQDNNGNSSCLVTEVTEAQPQTTQAFELSSVPDVSPVTVETKKEPEAFPKNQKEHKKTEDPIDEQSSQTAFYNEPEIPEENTENLSWLLQFLADLEATPAPHRRFSSNEQLVELFKEAEQRTTSCSEKLKQVCPDYFERFSIALGVVSEALPISEPSATSS